MRAVVGLGVGLAVADGTGVEVGVAVGPGDDCPGSIVRSRRVVKEEEEVVAG